jgi:chromosomal replication initiator protein
MSAPAPKPVEIRHIKEAVRRHFGLAPGDLEGLARTRPISHARNVAMYLSRQLTPRSWPQIGFAYGGRDHSTVIYGWESIRRTLASEAALQADLQQLIAAITALANGSDTEA